MDRSILHDIKVLLGIPIDVLSFDTDIIIGINSALNILNQIGVGVIGYSITGSLQPWSGFLDASTDLEMAKTFVHLKTKLFFDPPQTSFQIEATERLLSELSWRLMVQTTPAPIVIPDEGV